MIKFKAITFSHYELGNELYEWWSNTSHVAWQNVATGSYYLSDVVCSGKYKVAGTFEELIAYLQQLKEAYESED